jgi:hypothetical protein
MKGGKTRFQQKFTEDMFLNALSIDRIRSTAKIMLYRLMNEGKVNKIEIEGNGYGWQKVKGD